MFNRLSFISFNIAAIFIMCVLTIAELSINLIPFVIFNSYILDGASSEIIEDIERLKRRLFSNE